MRIKKVVKPGLLTFLWLALLFNMIPEKVSGKVHLIPPGKKMPSTLLIVVDSVSFQRVSPAIHLYRDAIEKDNMAAYIMIDYWDSPDSIKQQIGRMRRKGIPLEGLVLIGDIPIPMILDAQHLTSAFKIDQDRFPRIRSAVPSDRFYDDPDLVFTFVERDTVHPLLFYYSLTADSPQKIESDLYSGRIRPGIEGEEKYPVLDRYLRRVALQKERVNYLDRGLVISGHGYHSESLTAWANEYLELREHLPELFTSPGSLLKLYHHMDINLKQEVLLQLQQPQLDLAVFHAHGDDDMQYLQGLPEGSSVQENIEAVKYYLRSKLRQARRQNKPLEEIMADYMNRLDVPESWFSGAFQDSVIVADSLLNYGLDIHIADIRRISPEAEFIIHDQCFNGAFIHSPYIAGEYVFGNGETIAAAANSVNIIQDLWADQNLGLLAMGARVGYWNQQRNYLETHIIGDPTFHFTPSGHSGNNESALTRLPASVGDYEKFLQDDSPGRRAFAIQQLFGRKGKELEAQLVQIYQEDPAFIVRLQALQCLGELRSEAFAEILKISLNDPFELIRRLTVKWMGDMGREDYLPYLIDNLLLDPARRVNTNSLDAISKIGTAAALPIIRQRVSGLSVPNRGEEVMQRLIAQARSDSNWVHAELLPNIKNDTLSLKKRIAAVRTFRYYRFQEAVPELLRVLRDRTCPGPVREAIAEALGWYGLNRHCQSILVTCREVLNRETDNFAIAEEIRKTIRRLETGPNNVITP